MQFGGNTAHVIVNECSQLRVSFQQQLFKSPQDCYRKEKKKEKSGSSLEKLTCELIHDHTSGKCTFLPASEDLLPLSLSLLFLRNLQKFLAALLAPSFTELRSSQPKKEKKKKYFWVLFCNLRAFLFPFPLNEVLIYRLALDEKKTMENLILYTLGQIIIFCPKIQSLKEKY